MPDAENKNMPHNKKLNELIKKWQLKLESEPIQTPTGLIIFVSYKNQPAVLKIVSDMEEERTTSVLRHYNGHGSVKILETKDNATLMTRTLPGKHLKELTLNNEDAKATEILCEVIQKLHRNIKYEGEYPTIMDWAESFDSYIKSGDKQLPIKLVQKAKEVFSELASSQDRVVLLHGDLHHDNILFDEKRGWLAIDPKGVIGEAEIEVAAFLKNPIGHPEIYADEQVIKNRISTTSSKLNLNKERVILWTFALTVLSCIWLTEIDESPVDWLSLANKLENML